MTYKQFLKKFKQVQQKHPFKVYPSGAIRYRFKGEPDRSLCPITAVNLSMGYSYKEPHGYREAAEGIGLSPKIIEKIVYSSDGILDRSIIDWDLWDAEMRQDLLNIITD